MSVVQLFRNRIRLVFLLFILAGALIISTGSNNNVGAHAPDYPPGPHLAMNPNPYGYIPTFVYQYLTHANLYEYTPAYLHWISGPYPATTSITVTDGQNTAEPLKLNLSAVVGKTPSTANQTLSKVTRVTTPGVSGLEGKTQLINFGSRYNTAGAYEYTYSDFNFLPDGGFTKDKYSITVFTKSITEFSSAPKYRCVAEPRNTASSLTDFGACNESGWIFDIYVNRTPQGDYDNSIILQSKPLRGSPSGGTVARGQTYSLFPKVTNAGPFKTYNQQYMVVQNQNSDDAANAGIEPLTPAGNRDTLLGVDRKYNTDNPACSTSGTINNDCWFWVFKDLGKNKSVESEFKFKVKNTAEIGGQVCFRPFVKRKSLNTSVAIGDRLCYTVVDDNVCQPGTDFAGQPIDSQPDRNGDGVVDSLDCNIPPDQTYLRVYGNDIQAGGGFAPSCLVVDGNASIEGFSKSSTFAGATTWTGSSGQFAVSALGVVDGFFSSNMRGAESATDFARPPVGQTFGNTDNMTTKVSINSGGDSGVQNCIPDYAAGVPVETGSNVISTRSVSGKQALVFENRDVFVTGTGIRFQGADTGWTTIDDIPSFYLIVKGGNIYINPSVTQLDGVYIAQPAADGTKGEIITCATAAGVVPGHGGCGQQLVINGAFIARQVQFKRVFGKLTEATAGEAVADTKAAEVFNFSPEVYLSPLNDSLKRSIPFTKYDYITSLPPIL